MHTTSGKHVGGKHGVLGSGLALARRLGGMAKAEVGVHTRACMSRSAVSSLTCTCHFRLRISGKPRAVHTSAGVKLLHDNKPWTPSATKQSQQKPWTTALAGHSAHPRWSCLFAKTRMAEWSMRGSCAGFGTGRRA
jgi:hypothetical protein